MPNRSPLTAIFDPGIRKGLINTGAMIGAVPVTVTIEQGASQPDAAYGTSVVFDVVFSEAVTGFATGDVTLTGTAGATTGTVTGSGASYTVTVSGMTTCGTVIADVGAGVAVSVAHSTANSASTSVDNEVTYLTTYADSFTRADGVIGGGWGSGTGMFVSSNKAYANGPGRFAVWGTDVCGSYDQFAQIDAIVNGNFISAGPAVRMDAASSSFYGATINAGGYAIYKQVGGVSTTLAGVTASISNGSYTIRLAAIDVGSLGTLLCLYTVSGGVPTFVVAGHDPAAADLVTLKIGFQGAIDTATFPSGTEVGDNWFGGDFDPNDGIHDVPPGVGGWVTKSGSTWINEMQVGTEDFGPRSGSLDVAALCAAGGGGGGAVIGGGGGGGGVRYTNLTVTHASPRTCVVGVAGTRGWVGVSTATNGGDSSISGSGGISCTGGGRGNGSDGGGHGPSSGGSGGGVGGFAVATGPAGVSGEGNKGGDNVDSSYGAAGGGGANAVGGNSSGGVGGTAGDGGAGKQWPSASGGDDAYYGGGGGGGRYSIVGNSPAGAGGIGGGGQGGSRDNLHFPADGTPKTGGGGGGAGHNDAGGTGSPTGGSGGSGVVRFRYTEADWTP